MMTKINNNSDDAREISSSLNLTIAQLDMSMDESTQSVEQLITSVSAMKDCLNMIEAKIDQANDGETEPVISFIKKANGIVGHHVQNAVIALQFHDRLTQRISHIEANLRAIAELIQKPDQEHPELWKHLQQKLRSVYSTEQEQALFQTMLQGVTNADYLQPATSSSQLAAGEIELF